MVDYVGLQRIGFLFSVATALVLLIAVVLVGKAAADGSAPGSDHAYEIGAWIRR